MISYEIVTKRSEIAHKAESARWSSCQIDLPEFRCDPSPLPIYFHLHCLSCTPVIRNATKQDAQCGEEVCWTKSGPFVPHDFGIRPAITAPRARVSSISTAVESTDGIAYSYAAPKITTCENSRETHTHVSRTHRGSSNQIPARHFPLLRVIQAQSVLQPFAATWRHLYRSQQSLPFRTSKVPTI